MNEGYFGIETNLSERVKLRFGIKEKREESLQQRKILLGKKTREMLKQWLGFFVAFFFTLAGYFSTALKMC